MDKLGIYIHIPFCMRKCAYCDFYSIEDMDRVSAYVEALIAQIRSFRSMGSRHLVDSVYIGGGTPSVLSGEDIRRILTAVRSSFSVSNEAEITIEVNPGTLDTSKLSAYREAGIGRLSMGLQSADNRELKMLSRIHTREEFESSFLLARLEGFENINIDVMYALPGQSRETLAATLDYVMALSPEHISFYGLKLEPGTPFDGDPQIAAAIPSEDVQYEMYLSSAKKMEDAGYMQYEISNFAKLGMECRHNLKYWNCEEYLGFGPGAHSFFGGRMFSYAKDITRFIAMPEDSVALFEENYIPTEREIAVQYVMLGFRLKRGIDTAAYEARFDDDFEARYQEKMKPFLLKKYILKTKTGYRLSKKGMLISNYILSEILDFKEDEA